MSENLNTTPNNAPHIWTPAGYLEALERSQPIEIPTDAGIRGRILRGRSPDDFETLGSAERHIVFIMGPDGLSLLPGLEPLQALDQIGLTPSYVRGRVDQGYHFKLLVFEGGDAAPLATWDNALDMVAFCRPEIAADIEKHRDALRRTPLTALTQDLPETLEAIELAGPAHPDYMSVERYLALPASARENPAYLRRLLFHAEHLTTLFSGNGFTRTPDGQRGLAEYLIPNGPITALPDAAIVDLI